MSDGDQLARTILRVFADLEPERPSETYNVLTNDPAFCWLGVKHVGYFEPGVDGPPAIWTTSISDLALTRLAAIDALHRAERLLRLGWVFVTGRHDVGGAARQVCIPLLSVPVRIKQSIASWSVVPSGDIEISSLVRDRDLALDLQLRASFGGGALDGLDELHPDLLDRLVDLKAWIHDVADAAGLPIERILPPGGGPAAHINDESLNALVGAGIYVTRDTVTADDRDALLRWSSIEGIGTTSFNALYTPEPASLPQAPPGWVRSPLPLTAQQRRAVLRSRYDPVVALSGPPGNGKSHAAIAIAIDAVARGENVLVATRSIHATDVLGDLLARHPGPIPVIFGSSERRDSIASELAGGSDAPRESSVNQCERAVGLALEQVAQVERLLADGLRRETLAESAERYEPMLPMLSSQFPALFDADSDLDDIHDQLTDLGPGGGLGHWWRRRRARKALRTAGLTHPQDVEDFTLALKTAQSRRCAAELSSFGGTHLDSLWEELGRADDQAALAVGALLNEQSRVLRSLGGRSRRAVAALARALRAGRAVRRDLLRQIDAESLLRALPLWIGTLRDIEDLLPPSPGIFDLTILDEASQIDQPAAAPALLRAKRAVVAGDPMQLRHVSFLSDAAIADCLERHGIAALGDRLDLRRNSIFDVASSAAPVTHLDEHFRSVPHLIAFSARRFYKGHINLMTRHPRNEQVDAIDVVRVDGKRDDQGVNQVEVDAVEDLVRDLRYKYASIGVVSPFRAQADALEEMIIERFAVSDIEDIGLSVGTVHSFQGSECDVVIASLAICDGDKAGSWTFLQDPHLFNVLVTRARQRMIVVTSTDTPPEGLLRSYLDHESRPPGPPHGATPATPWIRRLADELQSSGLRVRTGYPVGRWTLDIVVGEGDAAVAVECHVHPAGPAAHIERRRALRRAGWRVVEAFPSRWDDDPVRAAVTLATDIRGT